MRKLDLPLLFITLALLALGLQMVWSASGFAAALELHDSFYYLKRQIIGSSVGLVVMLGLSQVPYKRLASWAPALYIFGTLSLLLVWMPGLSHDAKGAARWIGVGGFNFQPAELVKVILMISLATWFSRNRGNINDPRVLGLAGAGLGIPLALILLQPDFGSTAVIVGLAGVMVFLAGIPLAWFFAMAGAGSAVLAVVAMAEPYRVRRMMSFLDPFAHCDGDGYQVCQSLLALHNGGLMGRGFGEGQAKLLYLPEPHNDFIAAVLGEELGLWGFAILLGLYALFAWRCLVITRRAPDLLGTLLAGTFTAMVVGQACLNLGVVLSLVPPKGLVLPFMSYGPSAMIVNLLVVGILQSVSASASAAEEAAAKSVADGQPAGQKGPDTTGGVASPT